MTTLPKTRMIRREKHEKILMINTGGTFSSVQGEKGLTPGLSSQELLDELRLVTRSIELEMEDLFSVDSANIFPDDWAALAVSLLGLAASAYVSLRNLELSSEYRIRTKYGFFFRRSHPYTLFFCFLFLSIAAFVN